MSFSKFKLVKAGSACKVWRMSATIELTRSVFASCAHRYWNTTWSHEENLKVYGCDASEDGLGSNLRLDLSVFGGNESVLTAPLEGLKAAVDHQSLFDVHATSCEQIVVDLHKNLAPGFSQLKIWENERLSCVMDLKTEALSLNIQINNLVLEIAGARDLHSGLLIDRARVRSVVSAARAKFVNAEPMEIGAWSKKLFKHLRGEIESLQSLRIDLGSHEYLALRA